MARQLAGDYRDVAIDSRIRAELEIAEDGNGRLLYRTVDIGITEHRHHAAVDRTCHVRVAEDRYDSIPDFAFDVRVAENRDDAVSDVVGRQPRVSPHVEDYVVAAVPQVDADVGFGVALDPLFDVRCFRGRRLCGLRRWRRLLRLCGLLLCPSGRANGQRETQEQ
jgi:hypothetical protein